MPRRTAFESDDAEDHRRQLNAFIRTVGGATARSNYRVFLGRLFRILGDDPPKTWRFKDTTYPHPAFRRTNRRTGRLNDFLRVYRRRIIVHHSFFDERFRKLFPIRNGLWGNGDEVVVPFSTFGPKEQDKYLAAVRKMAGVAGDTN